MLTKRNTRLALAALGLLVFAGIMWGAVIKARAPAVLSSISQKVSSVGEALAPSGPVVTEPAVNDALGVVAAPPDPPEPVPQPEWTEPKLQKSRLDPRDACPALKGLAHNLCKCWSHELYPGPHGVSRRIYFKRGRCDYGVGVNGKQVVR